MLRIIIALFVASLAVLVSALVYLPWWGFLLALAGVFFGLMLAARWLVGRVARKLFMVPFKAKGAALKDAAIAVHEVAPASGSPAEVESEGEPAGPVDFYTVDVTISPGPTPGPFTFWEPGELQLVPSSTRIRDLDDMPDGIGVLSLEVFGEGRFGPDEGMKYFGPQRLRLRVAMPREAERRQMFRYYFETFGAVTFPRPHDGPASRCVLGESEPARESTRS